jgi:hypothetical protein
LILEDKMEADKVIIHARFLTDGTVGEIGERPTDCTPQEWFDFLSLRAPDTYQALAGGRGVFRLTRGQIDDFKAEELAPAS